MNSSCSLVIQNTFTRQSQQPLWPQTLLIWRTESPFTSQKLLQCVWPLLSVRAWATWYFMGRTCSAAIRKTTRTSPHIDVPHLLLHAIDKVFYNFETFPKILTQTPPFHLPSLLLNVSPHSTMFAKPLKIYNPIGLHLSIYYWYMFMCEIYYACYLLYAL